MVHQIWLANPYRMHFNWSVLTEEVKRLFVPVIAAHDKSKPKLDFKTSRVNSRYEKPIISHPDLVVYVVPAPSFGFIGVDFGSGGHDLHSGGLTIPFAGQVASEVYVGDNVVSGGGGVQLKVEFLSSGSVLVGQKRSPQHVAKLIYHELLHNRTALGNNGLHGHKGVSLGRAVVKESTPQSEQDIALMAKHLMRKTPCWTGGWAAVKNG